MASRDDRGPIGEGIGRFVPTDATSLTGDREDTLTHLMRLATRAVDVPMAYVALIDGKRLVLASHDGLPPASAGRGEIDSYQSLSGRAIAIRAPIFVSDQAMIAGTPEQELLGAVAHAAVPLEMPDGELIGTLCAAARREHSWSARDEEMLTHIAAAATLVLRNRGAIHKADAATDLLRRMVEPVRQLTDEVRSLTSLLGEHQDARIRTFAALAEVRVQAVEALIRDVHAATRAARERPPGGTRSVDMVELVRRSLARARAAAGSRDAHLDLASATIAVECDPLEVEASLTALLISLMHHAGKEGQIQVRVVAEDRVARLDIVKLGAPVPPTELMRMIGRFRVGGPPQAAFLRLSGGTMFTSSGAIRAYASPQRTAFRITVRRPAPPLAVT